MKIALIFDDWRGRPQAKGWPSIYNTPEGFELSNGDFHSGSTFNAEIQLDAEQEAELQAALDTGHTPVFWVGKPNESKNL